MLTQKISKIIWYGSRAKRNGTLIHAHEKAEEMKKIKEDMEANRVSMRELRNLLACIEIDQSECHG